VLYLSAKHAGSTHDSAAFQSTAQFKLLSLAAGEIGTLLQTAPAYGNGSCGCRIITPYSGSSARRNSKVVVRRRVYLPSSTASLLDFGVKAQQLKVY
jgi:hypothetical protein